MVIKNTENEGPKTRGYSLRTRSQAESKENIPAPVKKTAKRGATGAAKVLKVKSTNVGTNPAANTRRTRAQTKLDATAAEESADQIKLGAAIEEALQERFHPEKENDVTTQTVPQKRNGRVSRNKPVKENIQEKDISPPQINNNDEEIVTDEMSLEKDTHEEKTEPKELVESPPGPTIKSTVPENSSSVENTISLAPKEDVIDKPSEIASSSVQDPPSIIPDEYSNLEPAEDMSSTRSSSPESSEECIKNIKKLVQEHQETSPDNETYPTAPEESTNDQGLIQNPSIVQEEQSCKTVEGIPESSNQGKVQGEKSKEGKKKDTPSFYSLPEEEQLLIVRKKLEKIIHKKETDESKAVDLLKILDRMTITESLLSSSKIDLTLEALRFVIKDKGIVHRTESLLGKLKSVKKVEKPEVKDKKWREPEKAEGKKNDDIPVSSNLLQWMDKFMENDKRLDSLNKKLDSMKTGVKTIQSSSEKGERTGDNTETKKSNKGANDTGAKTNSQRPSKTKLEEEYVKVVSKLLESINEMSEDDEKVYYYLKDISYIKLDRKVVKNTNLEKTLKKLKHSSHEKTQKLARKLLDQLKGETKSLENIDDISSKMKDVKIKEKETSNTQSMNSKIETLMQRVEKVSIKESRKDDQKSTKLFATPYKLKTSAKTGESFPKPDHSLLKRLKHLELENNLHKIKMKLDEYKSGKDKGSKDSYKSLLKELSQSDVTLELLETTKIGLSLNQFRKAVDDAELSAIGKDIIKKWKVLVPVTKKEDVTSEEAEKEKICREKAEKSLRNHCRSLLISALNSDSSVPDSCKVDVEKLGAAIEEAIFERFRETSSKYRSQVQSRQFNIRSNVSLRENLVVGNLSPDEVAVMSHEDMANDDLKKMREDLIQKGLDSLPSSHLAGDKFCTCRLCLPPWIQK